MTYIQPSAEDDNGNQIRDFEDNLQHLRMPDDTTDIAAWQEKWDKAFPTLYRQTITDSQKLAQELAGLARHTRERIDAAFKVESELGYVHLLYDKFKSNLVHDLTPEQFADMYAQTIAYGLFSAKCMDNDNDFNWNDAIDKIPNTNPFLKSLIQSAFNKEDNAKALYDELEVADIINLLDNTDIASILSHFNRHTGNGSEDTVIYFYEDFLSAYEKETKKRRGVYYTPWQVVRFIVRAVDDILREDFGFKDGLADEKERTVHIKRDRKRSKTSVLVNDTMKVPAIQILDPATGTGTFIREVILKIHETFEAKHSDLSDAERKEKWNEYVPKQLLKRLNAFELMMAPYAVAHMKLAMELKATGYDFGSDERLNVILTNSLEPPKSHTGFNDELEQMTFFNDPLASEAYAADRVKNNPAINVVIGNPPYSGESANKGKWIMDLMEDYKKEPGGTEKLKERNPKWINDDYVKFIRYAQYCIEKRGKGIVAFINPHGFIDNPTFRGMRWKLLSVFDKIYILDLHGNSNRKEKCPDGRKDENVFDIQQGVSILLLVKTKNSPYCNVYQKDVYGVRDYKYNYLLNNSLSSIDFNKIKLVPDNYSFAPINYSIKELYDDNISIVELFNNYSVGMVTAKDSILIKSNKSDLFESIRNNYSFVDESLCQPIAYRPFDRKYVYYNTDYIERSRDNITSQFIGKDNYGLITARSNKANDCSQFYISNCMSEAKCGERTTQSSIFPLYTYSTTIGSTQRIPNLNEEIVTQISEKLGLPFAPDSDGGDSDSFAPIDLLDYIYAVLHSPKYRETYKEFLKIDFPRVPYPTDKEMFWKMVALGGEFRKIHLMESPLLDTLITSFPVEGENEVVKPAYKDGKVYINKTQYFDGVTELAWNFFIGGYQPMQKWLKDRKGKKLTAEEIIHYQKIAVALTETDRLMKEIDEVFEF